MLRWHHQREYLAEATVASPAVQMRSDTDDLVAIVPQVVLVREVPERHIVRLDHCHRTEVMGPNVDLRRGPDDALIALVG